MNKSYLFLLATLILLISCDSDIKAKFEITNQTNSVIDSVNIKSFDHLSNQSFITLKVGESKIYWLNMTNLPKVDGDYLLTFKKNQANKEIKRFGYFTNGYPLEEITKIQIDKDTVLIDQIFDNY
jgi:major membrane immunogen (membrane-anchored lipoprotein)